MGETIVRGLAKNLQLNTGYVRRLKLKRKGEKESPPAYVSVGN